MNVWIHPLILFFCINRMNLFSYERHSWVWFCFCVCFVCVIMCWVIATHNGVETHNETVIVRIRIRRIMCVGIATSCSRRNDVGIYWPSLLQRHRMFSMYNVCVCSECSLVSVCCIVIKVFKCSGTQSSYDITTRTIQSWDFVLRTFDNSINCIRKNAECAKNFTVIYHNLFVCSFFVLVSFRKQFGIAVKPKRRLVEKII